MIQILKVDGCAPLHPFKTISLAEAQAVVGGWVESVRLFDRKRKPTGYLLVNEEGLLEGLPHNALASALAERPIVGDCVRLDRLSELKH